MNKIAAIYIRVSTDAQREEGYSIDAQKEMLTAYCVSKSIKNYEYYIDGGFSGSNIDRPELKRLMKDIEDGKVGCVLVYKLDRLSRSQKDTLFLIEDVFNPNNVDFVSLNESMDTSTPLGRLMLGILSAFAQLERENIKERTSMGMKERVKMGYWMGGGRVPFGYDYDSERGILVPNKDAETVRKIYELYIAGYSTNYIARMLGLSYEKLARQILRRKTNAGFICFNNEEYRGLHEPIISLETYEKAMQLMRERSKTTKADSGHLLTGLVKCGYCGAKMRYHKWGKRGYKIICYSRDKNKAHLVHNPQCPNKGIMAKELENIVRDDLFSFRFKINNTQNQTNPESVADILEQREKKVRDKLKKLYLLFAENDNEALLEAIDETKSELDVIEKEIKAEKEQNTLSGIKTEVKKQLSTLSESWDYMTNHEKRNIIRSCVSEIVVDCDDVKLYYKLKL
ncbi:MAG: recombinase family protein [Clostridia bacterium]|nr:recombinase family protein [Clostridia bacterium]